MAATHTRWILLSLAAVLIIPLTYHRGTAASSHANGSTLIPDRPECPQHWERFPVVANSEKGQSSGMVAMGTGGLFVPGPITNIPEFHDCQRFVTTVGARDRDSVRYDSLYAIFAAFKLDSIVRQLGYGDVVWSSSNQRVASVDSAGRVTGISAGTALIRAVHRADTSVRLFADVDVGRGAGRDPATTIITPGRPVRVALRVGAYISLIAEAGPISTSPLPVAQVYSYGGTYNQLGIKPNFSCLVLFVDAQHKLRARMIRTPNGGRTWDACFTAGVAPALADVQDLSIRRITGGAFDDYPPVARWDWDSGGRQQFIGIKCGAAWCEIGLPAASSSPAYASATPTTPEERVLGIKGWYDEQRLAIKPGAGDAFPSRMRGTVIPHPDLKTYTMASDFTRGWVPTAYIALTLDSPDARAVSIYKRKLNLDLAPVQLPLRRLNQLFLCYGTKAFCRVPIADPATQKCLRDDGTHVAPNDRYWWTRVISAKKDTTYRCTVRRDHSNSPPGVTVPATTRWRWVLDDETVWERCTMGCCEVDALQ